MMDLVSAFQNSNLALIKVAMDAVLHSAFVIHNTRESFSQEGFSELRLHPSGRPFSIQVLQTADAPEKVCAIHVQLVPVCPEAPFQSERLHVLGETVYPDPRGAI